MAALALSPAVAAAAPCDDAVVEPVTIGLIDGGFDRGRTACQRAEVSGRVVGGIAPDAYSGDLLLAGRTTYGSMEWGLGVRLLAVERLRDGAEDTDTGYGPVEAQVAFGGGAGALVWAAYAIAELPYTSDDLDVTVGAIQLGGAALYAVGEGLVVHGRLAGLGGFSTSNDETETSAGAAASMDATIRIAPWLWLGAGVDVQVGWFDGGLDHVAARAGAHWRVFGPWRLELGGVVPVAGDQPRDLAVVLGARRDL
jgi:hypothetical protein